MPSASTGRGASCTTRRSDRCKAGGDEAHASSTPCRVRRVVFNAIIHKLTDVLDRPPGPSIIRQHVLGATVGRPVLWAWDAVDAARARWRSSSD